MTRNAYKCFFANVLKRKKTDFFNIDVRIQSFFMVLACWSWNTFGSDYSLESSWVWHNKLCTPGFRDILPYFYAAPLKLCQVGWGPLLDSRCQISPEIFDWVQLGWATLELHWLSLSYSYNCLGCVFRFSLRLFLYTLPSDTCEHSGNGHWDGDIKYLGVHLNNKLDWSDNPTAL